MKKQIPDVWKEVTVMRIKGKEHYCKKLATDRIKESARKEHIKICTYEIKEFIMTICDEDGFPIRTEKCISASYTGFYEIS